MGDEQLMVGVEQRRRELAAQARWALGWETLGLERGADQVRRPNGRLLLLHGLGRGVTPRTKRVLRSAPNAFRMNQRMQSVPLPWDTRIIAREIPQY